MNPITFKTRKVKVLHIQFNRKIVSLSDMFIIFNKRELLVK